MVEFLRIGYTRVLEVRVLHHFWLDEGPTVFDRIADATKKTERLLRYDVRQLLAFTPSRTTMATVTGLRGVFRTTGLGFLVALPDDAVLPLDTTYEFFVTVVDSDFANYTAQALARPGVTAPSAPALTPRSSVTVADPVPDPLTGSTVLHRYRANVPVLSNLTGVARGVGAAQRLYLSRDYPAPHADDAIESLVAVGSDLRQRVGDPSNAALNVVGLRTDLPVFVHQGDVPAITAPAGSLGAPAFGIELSDDTPADVIAVIRLAPRRPVESPFNFAAPDGTPQPRVYEVHLQNRWTTWEYHSKSDGSLTSAEAGPLPLTYFGNAGTKQKPPMSSIRAVFDSSVPPRIARLVSDIYV